MIMRSDVSKAIGKYEIEEMGLINKSELSRRMGCNRRTVDKYIEETKNPPPKKERKPRHSILDEYAGIIKEKVDKHGATAMAVYKFIEKKGYMGKYCLVSTYVRQHKTEQQKKATIRFETVPGVQAQVDWKEDLTMVNRKGEKYVVNIFLVVLGYSRLKYLKLTSDRKQSTLYKCLTECLKYYGGVPHEMLFDNMSTVIDRARTRFSQVVLNERFKHFADDAGFEVIACRAYRPQTKGKVEALASLVDRLKVYNEEFDTFEDLEKITEEFMEDINSDVSQATGEIPWERFKKEKEYLRPLPPIYMLTSYISHHKEYKVSSESMINYKGRKYSVPTYYIGKSVNVIEENDEIIICFDETEISRFFLSEKKFNYKHEHIREILASDAMKHKNMDEIDDFIRNNLSLMDNYFLE
jgi:transposase